MSLYDFFFDLSLYPKTLTTRLQAKAKEYKDSIAEQKEIQEHLCSCAEDAPCRKETGQCKCQKKN